MIRRLAIALGDRCTASCDMCCFECSPKGEQQLETGLIKDVMEQASNIQEMTGVGFTGGEPFLFFDQLLESSRYAHELGLNVQVNTNGFWGKDADLKSLKDAGVSRICFSTGKFHQRFVSLDTLKAAIIATREAGIRTGLNVMEYAEADQYEKVSKALLTEIKELSAKRYNVIPAGKAKKCIDPKDLICEEDVEDARCDFGGDVMLSFDGNYYMCCSPFARETKRLCLGSAKDVKLAELSNKIVSDDFLYVMLSNGLSWYVRIAREQGIDIPDKVCSPCQLCNMFFENNEFIEKIRPRVEKEADKLRLRYILGM